MNEEDVNNLAFQVLSSITRDLNQEIYSKLGGKLKLTWSSEPGFQAYASSPSEIDNPPEHTICFHYELVTQLYADIKKFEYFADNFHIQKDIKKILDSIIEIPIFPKSINKDDAITNMFISCLTWIYFHELGHLYQEHGYIRKKFALLNPQKLEEQYIEDSEKINQIQANISHVAEIAADYFGASMCSLELLRHFSSMENSSLINHNSHGEEFIESTYMFLCGLSSTLYNFYGARILHNKKAFKIEEKPIGSHPNPLLRLELIYKHIVELISLDVFKTIGNYSENRETITKIFTRAIFTGAYFWIIKNIDPKDFSPDFFSPNILNSEEKKKYMKVIVDVWKEIEPTILKIQRHSVPFGTLAFSDQFLEILDS